MEVGIAQVQQVRHNAKKRKQFNMLKINPRQFNTGTGTAGLGKSIEQRNRSGL